MFNKRRTAAVAASALLAVSAAAPTVSAAPSRARAWVQPAKVKIGGSAVIQGVNLQHNAWYALVLAVPDIRKGAQERLFGPIRSTGKGTLKTRVQLPVVTQCGRASLYLYTPKPKQMIKAPITLTHCQATKADSHPPKPPVSGSKGGSKTPPPPPSGTP